MNGPELLFIHRLGTYEGVFHGRCICCTPRRPETWAQAGAWWRGIVLECGEPIVFRQSVTDWTGEVWEPAHVYADEPCMRGLLPEDRIALINAQNYTCLVFDAVPHGLVPPFFISTVNPTVPAARRATVRMVNRDVRKLPEVQDYEAKVRSDVLDRWDAMLVPKDMDRALPIPIGLWLPASFVVGHRESAGVYAIREWLSDDDALVDIAIADKSLSLETGCEMRRQFQLSDGKYADVLLGSLRGAVDHAVISY